MLMYKLNPGDYLINEHEHGFQTKSFIAKLKQLLKTLTKTIHDHEVEMTFYSTFKDLWNADINNIILLVEFFVEFYLVEQLRKFGLAKF